MITPETPDVTASIPEPTRLFAFGTGWGVPFATAAPFPLKLATWLRMAGAAFEFVVANDPGKGPKGKSPWIEYDGVRMGDSSPRRMGTDLFSAHHDTFQVLAFD